jgi:hypothetical protein
MRTIAAVGGAAIRRSKEVTMRSFTTSVLVFVAAFTQAGTSPQEVFVRGNANGDCRVDISDPLRILNSLFRDGSPLGCLDAADANDDGNVDISDPISLLSFLFLGGPTLPQPFPLLGPDPTTGDELGCEEPQRQDASEVEVLLYLPTDGTDHAGWFDPEVVLRFRDRLRDQGVCLHVVDRRSLPEITMSQLFETAESKDNPPRRYDQLWFLELDGDCGPTEDFAREGSVAAVRTFVAAGGTVWVSVEGWAAAGARVADCSPNYAYGEDCRPGDPEDLPAGPCADGPCAQGTWFEDSYPLIQAFGLDLQDIVGVGRSLQFSVPKECTHPLFDGVATLEFDGGSIPTIVVGENSGCEVICNYSKCQGDRAGVVLCDQRSKKSGVFLLDAGWTLGYAMWSGLRPDGSTRAGNDNSRFALNVAQVLRSE